MNYRKAISFLILIATIKLLVSCVKTETRFEKLSSDKTGIGFSNLISEELTSDILDFFFFSGAGVAIGDINNDGLKDVYFSGNLVSGKLYLNKGNLEFEDITDQAGIKDKVWGTGVVMEDINQDGLLDIYVCASGFPEPSKRKNLLFINNGDLTFTESAKKYGIDDDGYSTQAVFFDYDRDNDLDLLIVRDPYDIYYNDVSYVSDKKIGAELPGTDKLYENLGNNEFEDVSEKAGIIYEGYSLGVAVSDINKDGWPDIYISNDFQSDDILYINDKNGAFKNQTSKHLKHTEFAGMGVSVADINNDAYPDIFVADMMPEDNQRLKMIIPTPRYDKFNLTLKKGYLPQYSRNALQLNNGNGSFSEIAQVIGVHNTDWSWAPLIADFDNDGDKDLFITNGLLKDLGDLDFIHYQPLRSIFGTRASKDSIRVERVNKLPNLSLKDYFFENQGGLNFLNKTTEWGIEEESISHGAAYGDLDNDGDLDLVINTINKEAIIYKNRSSELEENNYLKIEFKGPKKNLRGIGSVVKVFIDDKNIIFHENFPCQGYLSTVADVVHFGLGKNTIIDSLSIKWPDGKGQFLKNININQTLTISYSDATIKGSPRRGNFSEPIFNKIEKIGINIIHKEDTHTDFKNQPILLREHSKMGPGLAVGDLNGDGNEDLFVGNASGSESNIFFQDPSGGFNSRKFDSSNIKTEDMGVLIFDADNDNDNDIYVVSGGTSYGKKSKYYKDRLYINDGKGNFSIDYNTIELPESSGGSVSAADFDNDGDLDLFVCGMVVPGDFPISPENYLLINTTSDYLKEDNSPRFIKSNADVFSFTNDLGMISSALWTDFNNDGWTDLICVGEWNSIIFLKNKNGVFKNITNQVGIKNSSGLWNSITSADFDNDGDIDYIVGNQGINNRFRVSKDQPLIMYADDYDQNGRIDPVVSYFNQGSAYPVHTRGSLISQINSMRGRFKTHLSYAERTFDKTFLPKELKNAKKLKCEILESVYIENLGNSKFKINSLPKEVQYSPVFGMHAEDFNNDGNEDVLLVGNLYSMEVGLGREDASIGKLLLGNGKGEFDIMPYSKSGFLSDKDAKALVKINDISGNSLYAISNNNDSLTVFKKTNLESKEYLIDDQVKSLMIYSKNKKSRKKEFYFGTSYLSQSSRSLKISDDIDSVRLDHKNGKYKIIKFK